MNTNQPAMLSSPLAAVPLALGVLFLFASVLWAQSPSSPPAATIDPAVHALLDAVMRHRGALAAKPASTLQITGSYVVTFEGMNGPVAKGTFRDVFAGSDRARHTTDMGKMGKMERGITPELAWEVDPAMGAMVRRGVQGTQVHRWFALLRGSDPRTIYRAIERKSTAKVGDRDTTVLSLRDPEGPADLWYVADDGALLRVDMQLPAPESADAAFGMADMMDAQVTFGEWRPQGSGHVPATRTLRMGKAVVAFTCDTYEVGAKVDDATFVPPAAVLAKKPEAAGPAFGPDGKPIHQIVERSEVAVASIRVKCKPSEIAAQLAILLPEVMEHLHAVGAKMSGPPFSRYHAWNDQEIEMEAGIPVQAPIVGKGRVQPSTLPGGKAAMGWHVGPYEGLGAAHDGLAAFVAKGKHKARGGHWEVYWTDPGMVPDPSKWKTQLFVPIE